MSKLLNSMAVGQKTGDEATELLITYIEKTRPSIAQNNTNTMNKQPKGTGAGDHLIDPR